MDKIKVTKTKYVLNDGEIAEALRNFVVHKLNMSSNLEDHSVSIEPTLNEDLQLKSVSIEFEKTVNHRIFFK